MDVFPLALAFVLRPDVEGGLVDDPHDPGDRTNLGITEGTLRDARLLMDALPATVEALTRADAERIYRLLYWKRAHCDEMPDALALFTFDSAVQHDPRDAVRFVQRALKLNADGDFGPKTKAAVAAVKNWSATLQVVFARRVHHYMLLDKLDDRYGFGWALRVARAYDTAKGLL